MQQAFIRKSYSREKGGQNNEVLEFIGDKALDIAVVKNFLTIMDSMIMKGSFVLAKELQKANLLTLKRN